MSEPALRVQHLRKAFQSNSVLSDVSFELPAGKTLALLGRNGAGKTTMIRMLLGLLSSDSGVIQVAGCDPSTDPLELRRRVGYLAEDQQMYPWMTPVELCRFLRPFYPTWESRLADDYLDRYEIPKHTRIGRLSKGQTVKLGLAVALAHRPKVAILDDPSMGLDPIARREFNRELIDQLQGTERSVLYSSQLLAEVEAVADIIAILDRGRIVRYAETDHLREQVKLIRVSTSAAHATPRPKVLLDVRQKEDQFALVVDKSAEFLQQLEASGVEYEVSALSLDEIFEAFVIGRPDGWPGTSKLEVAGAF